MIPTAQQIIDICRAPKALAYVIVDIGRDERIYATIDPALLATKMTALNPDTLVPRARIDSNGDIEFRR